jgi:predicted MFS family arabinose efflux permease
MSPLALLRENRGLRRLFAAQLPADFADWLDFVAIASLLAFVWQAPPVAFAWLAVAMGVPYLVIGPVAGLIVDRVPIRPVLVLSNLGRALVTAAFLLAPDWPVLVLLVALRAAVDTAFTPAKQAALQALTPVDELIAANGLSHAINQASKIAAPGLGGVLLAVVAPAWVFAGNAAVSLVAAALSYRIGVVPRPKDDTAPAPFWASLGGGFAALRQSAPLFAAVALMAAGFFAMFFYDTLIAPVVRDIGFDETFLGLLLAAIGGGGVVGALLLSGRHGAFKPFALIGGAGLVSGGMIVGVGLAEVTGTALPAGLVLAGGVVAGVCSALTVVPVRAVIQRETPPGLIARVVALSEAANTLALLSAPFLGAALAAAGSSGHAFIAGGGLALLIALAALVAHARLG